MKILRLKALLLIIALALAPVLGCKGSTPTPSSGLEGTLTIFHAGSLSVPFENMSKEFNRLYPNVIIERESAGSRTTIRKVTELGKPADIIGSADYMAIEQLMFPEFADWYICFARNRMVIAYTDQSKYKDEINRDNWYEILQRGDVKFGRADPNADPCGYRTLLVWQLAEQYYKVPGLDTALVASCPKKNIRPKEVELIALLQSGELDYAWEYRSLAQQHHLRFLELPPQIDLSDIRYQDFYALARVDIAGESPGTTQTQIGEPIVYGVTIPKNAPRPDLALAFLKLLLGPAGQAVMEQDGQPAIVPAITSDPAKVPTELQALVNASK